jgi:hypothetical protein
MICSSFVRGFIEGCVVFNSRNGGSVIELYFSFVMALSRSRDSSVSIVMGYRVDGRGRFLEGVRNFSLFLKVPTGSETHTASLVVKRPAHEAEHSDSTSA